MTAHESFLFVSHVSEDRSAAMEIVEELERQNIRCWIAPRDVQPGKPFDDEIAEAIDGCRAMLLIFSERCNQSEYIRREVTVAGESRKIIILLRIENAQPKRGLRVRLSDLHWIDGFESRTQAIEELVGLFGPSMDETAIKGAIERTLEAPKPPAAAQSDNGAERRQVTVMVCELFWPSALSTQTDPEDLRELVSAYQRCVDAAMHQFKGYVADYHSDRVIAYFGYPTAHEDDPERAVRASLEAVKGIAALRTTHPLGSRVGIATGVVVVGDVLGSGDGRGMIGETPRLATALQVIAEPNMVVIGESTRKFLGDLFELRDLGTKELGGLPGPRQAWSVLRAKSVESRFEALHTSSLTTLVGRQEECDLLRRRWSTAKAGEGQVVLLSGEAGIGKSRLTAMLLEWLTGESHSRLRYFCSPQHTDSALYPIITQMERAAQITHNETPHAKLEKLHALLVQNSTPVEDCALLADMLSLPNDGRYPQLDLTLEQRRQRTLNALIAQLESLCRSRPVLMILEDVHWIDPTSLEALNRIVDTIAHLSVLLIMTFRPEFVPPWIGQAHVTAVTLNRLTKREIGTMIDQIVRNKVIAASTRQDIIERTDGIPLFVEEITNAVLEAESEGDAQRTLAGIPSPAMAVPPSLHASLMARLDRLGPAKEVAQIGAAIGREFSHAVLAAVVPRAEAELASALDRLIRAGLLFRRGLPPQATYLFKHALIQDAAYGTLLRERRRILHARIADALERQFKDIAERQPELVARHYTEAGLVEKAAGFWGKAGQHSLAHSALVEAAEQLTRALDQISTLPSTPVLRREQIELQVALITPLIHVKGYAAPETKMAAERARSLIETAEALGEPPEDPLLLFSVLYSFWVANYVAFNGEVVRELATQFLALAERQRTTAPLVIAHRLMGRSLMSMGELAQAREHFDRAIALYDPAQHRPLATRFGQDVRVSILSYRSFVLWILGYYDAAVEDAEQTLKDARATGQAATLMYALYHTSLIHLHCGNYATADAEANELVALAHEKGASYWKARGEINRGCILGLSGKPAHAVPMLTSAIATYRSTGAKLFVPWYLSDLARSYAELGQFDAAWSCLDEATAMIGTGKETWYEAEVLRTAGEVTLKSSQPDVGKAEEYFEHALAIARSQQAKAFELRSAVSLARLWRDRDRRDQARSLVASIYNWFPGGFDTLDLKEAKTLLATLEL